MAVASTNAELYVTVSAQTQSDALSLSPGHEYVLHFASAGDFALDLQVGDGTTFSDMYDASGTKITIDSTASAAMNWRVPGGQQYRMDVSTYNNPITMRARQC